MYKIDQEIFKETFLKPSKKTGIIEFNHASNKRFKDLPFVVRDKQVVKDFKGVTGEFLRLTRGKRLKESIDQENILNQVVAEVDCDPKDQYQLKNIMEQVYFNKEGELSLFSSEALLYTHSELQEEKIAKFIYDVLTDHELFELGHQGAVNVMDKLLLEVGLGNYLEDCKHTRVEYIAMLPMVKERFMEDFKYVISDEERIKKYLKPLLTHYYFFYIAQLAIKLNHMFDADLDKVEALFFSVEWEKLSRSRLAYDQGWKKLERHVRSLFSHSKLLEMLNQNNEEQIYTYGAIYRDINSLQNTSFEEEVKQVLELYQHYINDFDLSKVVRKDTYNENLLNEIVHLFDCIDAQFQKPSSRNRAYEGYSNWFIIFCKENILKNRRSLGSTLNLKEEDIIFLTKICIKDHEKMKLKDLFKAFEQRGVFLDMKSKEEIHTYFEKLNLIEKKSDSGDAQYVKGIL